MVRRLVVQDMDGDGEREYDDEVNDEEAYERFGSGHGRYGSDARKGGVYEQCEAMRIWEEFEGDG